MSPVTDKHKVTYAQIARDMITVKEDWDRSDYDFSDDEYLQQFNFITLPKGRHSFTEGYGKCKALLLNWYTRCVHTMAQPYIYHTILQYYPKRYNRSTCIEYIINDYTYIICLQKNVFICSEPCSHEYIHVRYRESRRLSAKMNNNTVNECMLGNSELLDKPSFCPTNEFQCANGQCVPKELRCRTLGMHREACADGSHLLNCKQHVCHATEFKCRSGPCIHSSMVCNSHIDCPDSWDDEDSCPFSCAVTAPECECRDISINCRNQGLRVIPKDIEPQISRFHFSGNSLTFNLTSLSTFGHIIYLDLSNNSLSYLPSGLFLSLTRLRILDLRNNSIIKITNSTFKGLVNLRTLHLGGNHIWELDTWAFYGLPSLSTLDLSHQELREISHHAFMGLRTLKTLNLSQNKLEHLPMGCFTGLTKLKALDVRWNRLSQLRPGVFNSLTNLDILWTDGFHLCCLARHVTKCLPAPDEFSSCEDLMSNVVLRVCVWVLGVIALVGNILVIVWRTIYQNNNRVHTFLINNLAIGDLCMGLYLLIIASVDVRYRGEYFIHDSKWRTSSLCNLAGFFSTFSSELSVFTLTVITLHRFAVINFPFRVSRLTLGWSRTIMAVVWFSVILLAGLPLIDIPYFKNFYGRSGVCLALHITNEKPSGWEYSIFVFLVLNMISFSVIAASYWSMYHTAISSRAAVRTEQEVIETHMARRMTLIVVTDAACWLPIIALGMVSLAGVKIPPQVFAWVAVFILPLNAAINPLLYTMSTTPFINRMQNNMLKMRYSFRRHCSPETCSSSIGK
ncbi:unnamed protein product, partial [Meganyctiphanes norvegica]